MKKPKDVQHWLDRELITSPIYYCLITTEALWKKELKRLGISNDHEPILNGADATTHFLEKDGREIAIVTMFNRKMDLLQAHALLAHEAVHIWQEIKKNIGEDFPSAEFEAYSIQRLSQNLFYEYKRQTKRNK
jgi:hypothetical protein